MSNIKHIHQQFEKEKNLKALGLTIFISISLFLFLFLAAWVIPQTPIPAADEGIEVNLGNIDQGIGDIPPQVPGEPSVKQETNDNPSNIIKASAETQPEVAENNERDAPVIPTSSKPKVKQSPSNTANTDSKTTTNKPVVNTTPKPKAVYAGGKNTDNGGNNADSYNKIRNQGRAGGSGDQGKPNGNPNSDNYTGNGGTGNGGINISSGLSGRKISSSTRFEDAYKYGGKVLVSVTVDENGTVISASLYQGSAFTDINKIAIKRAQQIKFSKGNTVQSGVITIKFENPKD